MNFTKEDLVTIALLLLGLAVIAAAAYFIR
jgi:hypothetical protein